MKLYSTNNKNNVVDLKTAVMNSLPEDRGLYMPVRIDRKETSFFENLPDMTFKEIAFEVALHFTGDYIPQGALYQIIDRSIDFQAPVFMLDDHLFSLELWHGPSLAFKDFGARFMAQLMSFFVRNENRKTTILVATSGDTGGAVAAGFYDTPGIEVIILYPSGKVSNLQEKQLTTLGNNITALEIQGTFDDCQRLVKTAFLDDNLRSDYNLSSANSINIARLLPQTFYYFEAYKQLLPQGKDVVFAVPSGNFGNLTAGLMAKRVGLPVKYFFAATNINHIVPDYLKTGIYLPRPSKATISNAMDVGDPSNFVRILDLYNHDYHAISKDIKGFYLDDLGTKKAIKKIYNQYGYITDPHGAIAAAAIEQNISKDDNTIGFFLETAHPSKFLDTIEDTLDIKVPIPDRLKNLKDKKKMAVLMSKEYGQFKDWLLSR